MEKINKAIKDFEKAQKVGYEDSQYLLKELEIDGKKTQVIIKITQEEDYFLDKIWDGFKND